MPISNQEFQARQKRTQELIAQEALDGLVVAGAAGASTNSYLRYVSGVRLSTRRAYAFFPREGSPILFTATSGHQHWAKVQGHIEDVRCDMVHGLAYQLVQAIAGVGKSRPRIGIAGWDEISGKDFGALSSQLPGVEWVDAAGLLLQLRQIKTPAEIQLIEEASAVARRAYETAVASIRPGIKEYEVDAEARRVLMAGGAEDVILMVSSGPWPAFIRLPGPRILEKGDIFILNLEFGLAGGYWTQLIRPISLGHPSEENARIFELNLQVQREGEKMLRPGNTAGEVATVMRKAAEEFGYDAGVQSGHGIGLAPEGPALFPENTTILKENMTMVLHPHIGTHEKGGHLLADTYLLTRNGARKMTEPAPELKVVQ